MNHTYQADQAMRAIFAALQDLLELAAPSMREQSPQIYADAMTMVASGRASFAAKVSTSPATIMLTLDLPDGEKHLVAFSYQMEITQ